MRSNQTEEPVKLWRNNCACHAQTNVARAAPSEAVQDMTKFAFISRHAVTANQVSLAEKAGIEMIPVGDRDGFSVEPSEFVGAGFSGVVVVHAALAVRCLTAGLAVGVFENAKRAPVGAPLQFHTTRLVVWTPPEEGTTGDWVVSQEEFV